MKKIEIDFFPVVGTADLYYEGSSGKSKAGNTQTNSLANRLKTTKIDEWLYPYRKGYQVWRGLLMEMMDEVDDDDLEITVISPDATFEQISKALNAQKDETDDMGFRHDGFRLRHEKARELDECKGILSDLYEQAHKFMEIADQEDAAIENAYKAKFNAAATFEELYEASKLFIKLSDMQIEKYGDNEMYANTIRKCKKQVKELMWGDDSDG
ncbi:MAG: hypothetical protein LUG86_08955 [Oscillospiraceae bacterium]|nr:hypothetical protein [Oscillospiraceae bacterium]